MQVAQLYANGKTPDPEVEMVVRQKLATARIEKCVRETLAISPTLHPAQVEYLAGLLDTPGGLV
ncbi:hypothetical protein DX116_00315 [Aeromicrobium endophyticum]|uniref:Uncharacterized protein n=2 Tax=Aeromicrobium endophyticum TaxID=2292704 RepID=A0A371P847_9ACTN|nr:hypothetical protein DX116_00315 [Aeromicrobium endophyticum]